MVSLAHIMIINQAKKCRVKSLRPGGRNSDCHRQTTVIKQSETARKNLRRPVHWETRGQINQTSRKRPRPDGDAK